MFDLRFSTYISDAAPYCFVWDNEKNRRNRIKHGVDFARALQVFNDPHARSRQDRIVDGELRWQTLGLTGGATLLLVAHTYDDTTNPETITIISARRASPAERQAYEKNRTGRGH